MVINEVDKREDISEKKIQFTYNDKMSLFKKQKEN
jgi:hypothetical protein